MNIWQFFDNHCFLALLSLGTAYGIIVRIIRFPLIMFRGWPPSPMDADGDIHYPSNDSNVDQPSDERRGE